MLSQELVDLSRLQFAMTAMYHFLFVPLTLGLSFMLVVMEACYVVTGREVYKDMTRFWGKLFGINFALGVATGITMEFQFGTNWAYYSHYVGDIFGAPLAIEGLMAFFLESTFIGLFFFGWNRLSKGGHMAVTFLMALGSNLSALWILVANAWMQYPVGSEFNYETMRMEMNNFWEVVTSPWAQAKFMHTINAGYMTGAMFVLAISAWYLIRGRDIGFAKRSLRLAAVFGFVASILTVHLGDESGYLVTQNQPQKIASMEAVWETHEAPAPLSLFAITDEEARKNTFEISFPWLMGLMGTRSLSQEIEGINPLVEKAQARIINGQRAVTLLESLRKDKDNASLRVRLEAEIDGKPSSLEGALPRPLLRNRIYTVTVRKDATDTDARLTVEAWGDGGETPLDPDLDTPLTVDTERSELPDGVRVEDGGSTLVLPYTETEVMLAVACDSQLEVIPMPDFPLVCSAVPPGASRARLRFSE